MGIPGLKYLPRRNEGILQFYLYLELHLIQNKYELHRYFKKSQLQLWTVPPSVTSSVEVWRLEGLQQCAKLQLDLKSERYGNINHAGLVLSWIDNATAGFLFFLSSFPFFFQPKHYHVKEWSMSINVTRPIVEFIGLYFSSQDF